MKFALILLAICSLGFTGRAQSPEAVIANSREYSLRGDIDNAILILKNGLDQYTTHAGIRQELAMAYYTAKRYPQAMETLKPLLDNETSDETVFQIGALIYRGVGQTKEAEKVYKNGLRLHPKSGLLYNEYGQMMEGMNPGKGEGIKLWEKGIQADPGFAINYYNAARYHAIMNNTLWAILYGEIFVNLDSYSGRSIEIKNLLFQFYKKVFAYGFSGLNEKNVFENTVAECLLKQKALATAGINPETLAAIRARFILDWFRSPVFEKYPFRLFERHQQMLREGFFDAYNQWLFGGAANLAAFQNWTKTHNDEYQAFTKFQRQNLFVINQSQFYR